MFIYNFKLNGNKLLKYIVTFLCVIILILCVFSIYKIFGNGIFKSHVNDEFKKGSINEINSRNYTNVLDEVHNNLDLYVGQKIKYSGFVYRIYDFSDDQFVLGRNMIISSDFQTVVVGFLCQTNLAKNFTDNSWVEIEGEITKGDYHGEIPVIKITNIKQVNKPNDEYVYPPDETYVPTSTVL